jgi:hypothetical protein
MHFKRLRLLHDVGLQLSTFQLCLNAASCCSHHSHRPHHWAECALPACQPCGRSGVIHSCSHIRPVCGWVASCTQGLWVDAILHTFCTSCSSMWVASCTQVEAAGGASELILDTSSGLGIHKVELLGPADGKGGDGSKSSTSSSSAQALQHEWGTEHKVGMRGWGGFWAPCGGRVLLQQIVSTSVSERMGLRELK